MAIIKKLGRYDYFSDLFLKFLVYTYVINFPVKDVFCVKYRKNCGSLLIQSSKESFHPSLELFKSIILIRYDIVYLSYKLSKLLRLFLNY